MDLPRLLERARLRLRVLLRSAEFERDMDEEMRIHLEMEIEERVRNGMKPEQARRSALRDFGQVGYHKEDARAARGLRFWEDMLQDLRFGARTLARRPAFTAVAVLTLAVGIGSTTAIFSLANWILIRPVPGVQAPEELVLVLFHENLFQPAGVSFPNIMDLRDGTPALSGLAGWASVPLQLAGSGTAARPLRGAAVAGDYFGVLGAQPHRGRYFLEEELGAVSSARVAVISHELWRSAFSGGEVVGRFLRLNGNQFEIVGVAPAGFRGLKRLGDTDVWVPASAYSALRHNPEIVISDRGMTLFMELVGRLQPGATAIVAEDQLRRTMDLLIEAYPEENEYHAVYRPNVFPGIGVAVMRRAFIRETLTILLGVVSLVLLIACANVANLLLFRGAHRRGEMAMRRALGASAGRVLRQHLVEGTLLSVIGAAAGLLVAMSITRYFEVQEFWGLPPVGDIQMDWRVLGFALLLALVTGSTFGTLPALFASRQNLRANLKSVGRAEAGIGARLRGAFTVVQIGASLMLLIGALLLTRTLHNLHRVELGFDPNGILAFALDPDPQGYSDEQVRALRSRLLQDVSELPGVRTVGLSSTAPFVGGYTIFRYLGGHAPDRTPVEAHTFFISPTYFQTLAIPLLAGRTFLPAEVDMASESAQEGPIILSRALAQELFGEADPIGRLVIEDGYRERFTHTVVGVADDIRTADLRGPPPRAVYRPIAAARGPDMWLLLRSNLPQAQIEASVRDILQGIDSSLPFDQVGPITEGIRDDIGREELFARVLRLLAVLATGLAAVGLYGLVSYSVVQRTREIGIRVALGARAGAVIGLVARQFAVLVAIGTIGGWLGALALSRLLASQLYGVAPLDPQTYAMAAAILALVALAASLAPARAATRIDPVRALKAE